MWRWFSAELTFLSLESSIPSVPCDNFSVWGGSLNSSGETLFFFLILFCLFKLGLPPPSLFHSTSPFLRHGNSRSDITLGYQEGEWCDTGSVLLTPSSPIIYLELPHLLAPLSGLILGPETTCCNQFSLGSFIFCCFSLSTSLFYKSKRLAVGSARLDFWTHGAPLAELAF